MDDTEVVAAVRTRLADKIGSDRFELWFGPNVRLVLGESTLAVHVPNQFHQNWLRRNFRRDLETVCQEVLGRALEVEFRIVPALDAKQQAERTAATDPQRQFTFDEDLQPASIEATARTLLLDPPSKRATKNLPVPVASLGRKYAALESFVVGSTNRLAFAAAEMVIDKPGSVNPLFIHGPTGVGKTHLLEGLLSELRRLHPNLNAIFLTAEQFTTTFLEALHRSGLPSFRHKYRAVDLLILDDLQFFAGKAATLVEFSNTLDTLVRQGRQLVVAADRPLAELTELCPQLITRLSGGMVAKVTAADHAMRVGIVRKRAAALGLQIDDDVPEFVATHLTSHARELIGALHQLLAASRIRREPITRSIAEEALADLIQQRAKPVQFQQIEKAVCEIFGLNRETLQQSRRSKALNAPRMVAMWLARKHTRAALSEIGHYFGRRSHSTVIAAHKAVGKWVAEQTELRLSSDTTCKAEDAIRRVEAKLRAG
ncbi:MAG: chromosomal replication initiator protein DnaA [Pirellulales bacterium]